MLGKAGNISISIPGPGQSLQSAYGGMWRNGSWAPASAVLLSTCGHILDAFLACSAPGWGLGRTESQLLSLRAVGLLSPCVLLWLLFLAFLCWACLSICFLCFSSESWDLTVHKYQCWSMGNLQVREAWFQTYPCCSSRDGLGLAEHSVPCLTSLMARLCGYLHARH